MTTKGPIASFTPTSSTVIPVEGAARFFYTDIVEEGSQQETSGFFCEACLGAYDLVTDERLTLLSVIKERVADATAAATGFR